MPASLYETAQMELDALIDWVGEPARDRNEAATRLHIIDVILSRCLGWPSQDVAPEEHIDGKYIDYLVGSPAPMMILEAKREGEHFDLPEGFADRTCPIKVLLEEKNTQAAMEQAMNYCAAHGVGIGVVFNGHELIAFIGSRDDGVPVRNGRALVFTSLRDMREDFRLFWDCLSRAGIQSRYAQRTLRQGSALPPPRKISAEIANFPRHKPRNALATELKVLGEYVLEDSVTSPDIEDDFLSDCYYSSGALSQYASVGRHILESRYSTSVGSQPDVIPIDARTKHGVADALFEAAADRFSSRPVVLLGDVGVGKSIFIRHFVRIDAKDILSDAIVLHADFLTQPALQSDLRPFILKEFASQLLTTHEMDIEDAAFVRGTYNKDLNRFAKGIYGELRETDEAAYKTHERDLLASRLADREGHLRASLEQIVATSQKQVVVFLDNIDQRPPGFQEEVFEIAHAWAASWPGTVFVSLRPDTFYASRNHGTLDAYQPRVFTIAPPRVDRVIGKRLDFVLRGLRSEGRLDHFSGGLTLQSDTLTQYLSVLADTFERHDDVNELIDNLSGGNVRTALQFVISFMGSGHVNTEKIISIISDGGTYLVPKHEFLRAILFGDYEYFDPESCPLANLFDISSPDGREHFLLPILLAHAGRVGGKRTANGYVDADTLFKLASSLGFSVDQAAYALDRAVLKRLLDCWPPSDDESFPERYRITTVGAYSLSRLSSEFTYLDAVVTDTPLLEGSHRDEIRDVRALDERLTRCEQFVAYLDDHWEPLAEQGLAFDWPRTRTAALSQIGTIRERVGRPRR